MRRLVYTPFEYVFRSRLDQAPVAHDQHFVGNAVGLVVLVRREHDGHAPLAARLPEDRLDLPAVRRVHAGRGLVEQQHVGFRDQRPGQAGALGFPARKAVGRTVGERLQAHLVQHARHPFFQRLPGHAAEPQARRHVLEHGGPEQVDVLHEQRDAAAVPPAPGRVGAAHGPALEEDPALLRMGQQGEYVQERRLARPVRPVDGVGSRGGKGEAVHMQMKPGAVTVRQVLAHDDRIGHQSSNPCSQ